MTPIKKVTEVSGIADKLLERFQNSALKRGREAQDNALCLSLLNHNERTFKHIRDSLMHYTRYLDDTIVYDAFTTIARHAREHGKPDQRVILFIL